jgi:tyrosyl-tRNA synthetase
MAAAMAGLPTARASALGLLVVDLMAASGLVPSKAAARRAIVDGGAYVNNVKVLTEDAVVDQGDLLHGRWALLRRGKRSLAVAEFGD